MLSWGTIKSLLLFFGPALIPKAISLYRSIRAPSSVPPTPVPLAASRSLNILCLCAFVFLLSTLPKFIPEDVFTATGSRLQTPTGVLFTRLSAVRNIGPLEEKLKDIFAAGGLEARLQYLRFGPKVLCNCPLVDDPKATDAGTAYLICALPSLLSPHLFHLAILGLATSIFIGGEAAAKWRKVAVITGLVLCALDLLSVATYEYGNNARATSGSAIESFFRRRLWISRLVLCVADCGLAGLLYASSTNRFFVTPPSKALQLEMQTRGIEQALSRFRALGAVRNVVMRDQGFREKLGGYWRKEADVMQEIFEERDVVTAMNEVVGRMDLGAVDKEAGKVVDGVLGPEGGVVGS